MGDFFSQSRDVALRMAHSELAKLPPHDGKANSDWLLEHAPWLWSKPRVKVFVSMKTGKCSLYRFEHVPPGTRHFRFLIDRPGNMFGVAIG